MPAVNFALLGVINVMAFQDHFSKWAEKYSRHRPMYPAEMFAYLSSLAPERELAWDCGTGNGQAAIGLARWFNRVVATDGSQAQLRQAAQHPRISYLAEQAEKTSIDSGIVDLVTVGTAVHWFDLDSFYREVRRVSKKGAILAVWTYHLPVIESRVDRWLEDFYRVKLAQYWPHRIEYLDKKYRTLPFPFEEIEASPFSAVAEWDVNCLIGFLSSWSASRRYVEANDEGTFEGLMRELEGIWGDTVSRTITWPLHFRIGRVYKQAPLRSV
jgi:ubiquinone/menaquinone biosynthesis C-methylase UbiE